MLIQPTNQQLYMLLDILDIINQYLDNDTLPVMNWFVNRTICDVTTISNDKGITYDITSVLVFYIIPCISYIDHQLENSYNRSKIYITKNILLDINSYVDPFVTKSLLYNETKDPIQACYDLAITMNK